jgi:inorganic pyrophosphatase
VFIFVLLSSQDGFSTKWHTDEQGVKHAPALYNGAFSTIAFLVGAVTSILSGWLGMTIATYANARTALEARKGIAPAFMTGKYLDVAVTLSSSLVHRARIEVMISLAQDT